MTKAVVAFVSLVRCVAYVALNRNEIGVLVLCFKPSYLLDEQIWFGMAANRSRLSGVDTRVVYCTVKLTGHA